MRDVATGADRATWLNQVQTILDRYREELVRQVAAKLIRPRQLWAVDELRDKMVAMLDDPVGIDRALKPIAPAARQVLRLVDLSRQPRWPLQSIVDLLPIVGAREGLGPVRELLDAGLIFPDVVGSLPIESFDSWLSQAATAPLWLVVPPSVSERCRGEALEIAFAGGEKSARINPLESDGLEWLLRLAVAWQLVRAMPLRMTQAGGYFKRDLDRLRGHPLLNAPPAEGAVAVADPAILAVELARGIGLVKLERDELVASDVPNSWSSGLQSALDELWPAIWRVTGWDPLEGYLAESRTPQASARGLALVAALASLPAGLWTTPKLLAQWLVEQQPDFGRNVEESAEWATTFLLGVLQPIRAVDAVQSADDWQVRLSALAQARFTQAKTPAPASSNVQTLLVQPNLEIVLYRQGLSPELLGLLTRVADWKQLGLACTLTLSSESVYRGLETGLSLADVIRVLERHSTRPLPDAVVETMRSWATKRERVQVFPAAVLLEFRVPSDLDAALRLGLVDQRVTDRIGLVATEDRLDYSRFRLVGSRDYQAPEERCVDVDDDGLTLLVQDGKADLLLSAEARRFADAIEPAADERTRYRASIESLQRARGIGVDLRWLEEWFLRRTGSYPPPTLRLLFLGSAVGALNAERLTIVRTPTLEVADGLERWPIARTLLMERIGPTSFSVREQDLTELSKLLAGAGITINHPHLQPSDSK